MTGRLSKLRRRRDTVPSDPAGAATTGPVGEQATDVMPITPAPLFADAPPAPAPAGPALPADVAHAPATAPGFRDRGRYRRRLRYLRRVRELGFRDLGGLVFDLHRFGRTGDELVRAKLVALDAVDRELRALERVLKDERAFTDLREPGVAACARCGALHGSDARFCPACGTTLGGPSALGVPAAAGPAGPPPAPAPAPASDTPGPLAVASPIMPLPEPEPVVADPAAPDPAPAEPHRAAATGTNPVTAAALGLPVPSPLPVPPLPRTPAPDGDDQPTVALPRVDAGDRGR